MSVSFRYAMVEINGKPLLVDKKAIGDAAQSLREEVSKIQGMTTELLKKGFALETPDGMNPVNLGSADDFANWVSDKLAGGSFSLSDSIGSLPDPFKSGLSALTHTELVVYSAALFYTGDTGVEATKNKLYGELLIGFEIPDTFMKDFPLALREVVIEVNNYPQPAT